MFQKIDFKHQLDEMGNRPNQENIKLPKMDPPSILLHAKVLLASHIKVVGVRCHSKNFYTCYKLLGIENGKKLAVFGGKKKKKKRKGEEERAREGKQMQTQNHSVQQQQSLDQQMVLRGRATTNSNRESLTGDEKEEEETKSALMSFRAKEEEIERKKMEVREKVHARLGRVEEETKRLADIREELESMIDPMRKEVATIRKKIDTANRELKPLGHACQKKEKEYKDALDAFNEKNKEKGLLITKLMELVTESERLRMKKLEELSKHIDSLH